jgi:hypothetical protein
MAPRLSPVVTANKLMEVMTLECHEPYIHYFLNGVQAEKLTSAYISYFPDGKEMIRGSGDKTKIEEAQNWVIAAVL